MKIAILSDVHGNYPALLKVLDAVGCIPCYITEYFLVSKKLVRVK